MTPENIKTLLSKIVDVPSKWELDTIIWADRTTNPKVLIKFLTRIDDLSKIKNHNPAEKKEYDSLIELLADLDEKECVDLLNATDEEIRDSFIEDLARTSAIEVLCNGKVSVDTMNTTCKLSPNDFILCAKRTQDLINAIHGLVIKGETLSKDVAGA